MSYQLQCLVGEIGRLKCLTELGFSLLGRPQGFGIIVIDSQSLDKNRVPQFTLLEGEFALGQCIEELCVIGPCLDGLAYLESEYFGGTVDAVGLVFGSDGRIVKGHVGLGAINQALSDIGAQKLENQDEFGTLNLGDLRHSEEWFGDGAKTAMLG